MPVHVHEIYTQLAQSWFEPPVTPLLCMCVQRELSRLIFAARICDKNQNLMFWRNQTVIDHINLIITKSINDKKSLLFFFAEKKRPLVLFCDKPITAPLASGLLFPIKHLTSHYCASHERK